MLEGREGVGRASLLPFVEFLLLRACRREERGSKKGPKVESKDPTRPSDPNRRGGREEGEEGRESRGDGGLGERE